MSVSLAASAEMLYLDLPFEDRVRRLHELDFLVEIWDWTRKDLRRLAQTGARFSSMTGYVTGELVDPDGSRRLLESAERSLRAAEVLDCPRLNVHGTGLDDRGLPVRPTATVTTDDRRRALHTLHELAALGARYGRVFTLENLNTLVDHPGVPFARAAETIELVEAVDSPHLRLNLDLYHAQIGEGNLIALIERALPLIGEVQVADVPGRQEPGTGEIAYPVIALALDRLGYRGVVGLEGWASGAPEDALSAFREAFSPRRDVETERG